MDIELRKVMQYDSVGLIPEISVSTPDREIVVVEYRTVRHSE